MRDYSFNAEQCRQAGNRRRSRIHMRKQELETMSPVSKRVNRLHGAAKKLALGSVMGAVAATERVSILTMIDADIGG